MKRKSGIYTNIIYSIIAITIIYFAFLPIIAVFIYGSSSSGDIGLYGVFYERITKYLTNSLKLSIPVTFIAVIIGFISSTALWRFKFCGRGILRILILLPIVNPPFVGSIAYLMLFGKRGLISYELLGIEKTAFGYKGVLFMQIIGLSTLAYMIISSGIKKMDVTYEEAARNLGASEWNIFKNITFHMMIPEITVAAMLVFLSSMADFGTPIIIGGPFQTLASDLYIQITGLYNMKAAAISGTILFIPCVAAFIIQKKLSDNKVFYSSGIQSFNIEYDNFKPLVKSTFLSITLFFIAFILTIYIFIVIGALTVRWGFDYSFTLKHVQSMLSEDLTPFWNSLKLAFGAGLMSSIIGVILAYLLKSKKLRFAKQIDLIATLPAAVPGILFGIGYLVTFRYPLFGIGKIVFTEVKPWILLGTGIVIYIISTYRSLNIGLKAGYTHMEHLNPNLELASINLGANENKTFFYVIFPNLRPALTVAFFRNFTSLMTSLGAIIFLILPKNKVAIQQIFQVMSSSEIGVAAAMAVTLSFLSLAFIGLFQLIVNFKYFRNKVRNIYEH